MGKLIFEQADVIDAIKFHLSLSDQNKRHPEYRGGSNPIDLIRGYALFVADELERSERNGIPERDLEIMLQVGGRQLLGYVIGDDKLNRFIKAAKEDYEDAES